MSLSSAIYSKGVSFVTIKPSIKGFPVFIVRF